MAILFILLVGLLNLGLGFGAAVVIRRRHENRVAVEPTEHTVAEPDAEEHSDIGIDETAEEAIEAVEELLNQVGLDPIGNSEADATDEGDSEDDDETDSEDAVEADDT